MYFQLTSTVLKLFYDSLQKPFWTCTMKNSRSKTTYNHFSEAWLQNGFYLYQNYLPQIIEVLPFKHCASCVEIECPITLRWKLQFKQAVWSEWLVLQLDTILIWIVSSDRITGATLLFWWDNRRLVAHLVKSYINCFGLIQFFTARLPSHSLISKRLHRNVAPEATDQKPNDVEKIVTFTKKRFFETPICFCTAVQISYFCVNGTVPT